MKRQLHIHRNRFCRWLNSTAILVGLSVAGFVRAVEAPKKLAGFDEALRSIAESEYDIRWHEETGSYMAANRAQDLRFRFLADSFSVEVRQPVDSPLTPWAAEFQILGLDRGQEPRALGMVHAAEVAQHHAQFHNDSATVEYLNDTRGMRQNFILDHRPDGRGLLRLGMATRLDGVHLFVSKAGEQVQLLDNLTEEPRLFYDDLRAWDARGRSLAASFQPTSKGFDIVVDDQDATYPVVIDPISYANRSAPNGAPQNGANFGYSVASDKHGLLVGSPYYDTGTLADAGKVFFFLFVNATSSLHTTADWTVEGDQANAHLGKVVVGRGDPVGQGYFTTSDTDIIASAPEYDSSGYTDNGKVLIWKTSSATFLPTSTTPDWTAVGTANSAYFGRAVATVRGVKGDTSYSLAVGAPGQSVVYVYYGSPSAAIPSSPNWSNTGLIASVTQNTTYSFGSAIAQRTDWILNNPDDVTGDGYADLIVGMPNGTAYNGSFASYGHFRKPIIA